MREVIEYFYRWKVTPEYRAWKDSRVPEDIVSQLVSDFHADQCHVSQFDVACRGPQKGYDLTFPYKACGVSRNPYVICTVV